jgi:hypothetical protein
MTLTRSGRPSPSTPCVPVCCGDRGRMPAQVVGVRFDDETLYGLIDIDRESPYHPEARPLAPSQPFGQRWKPSASTVPFWSVPVGQKGYISTFPYQKPSDLWVSLCPQAMPRSSGLCDRARQTRMLPQLQDLRQAGNLQRIQCPSATPSACLWFLPARR